MLFLEQQPSIDHVGVCSSLPPMLLYSSRERMLPSSKTRGGTNGASLK